MDFLVAHLEAARISNNVPAVVISSDEELESAKVGLIDQKLLAFDCEGIDLGRSGKVCIVQLSSREKCFLFDVLDKDKDSLVVLYLKSVLEDESVVKIIHDCKMDSDALFHLCGIKICNCHDTQVWDKILFSRSRGNNLNRTLLENGCEANTERDGSVYDTNNAFWATRPMTKLMIDWASGDVNSLFELYDKQIVLASEDQAKKCKEGSVLSENFLRPCVTEITTVKKMGKLIGPGGSNLRIMMELVPGSFVQSSGPRASGVICVYAPDEEALGKVMTLIKAYQ